MTIDAHRTKDEDDDGWTDDATVRVCTIDTHDMVLFSWLADELFSWLDN